MQRNKKVVVLIHVDALRHDYITAEDAPFLYSLAQEGIFGRIIPPFAFEPDGAYFAGLDPGEYEGGTHFIFSPETSPFQFARYAGFLDYGNVYVQYPFRKIAEAMIRMRSPFPRIKALPVVVQIPFRLLPYFDYCEKYFPFEDQYIGGRPTIFTLLKEYGKQWFYHGAPKFGCDLATLRGGISHIPEGTEFVFLMSSDLDRVGHSYGPESSERRKVMKSVDQFMHNLHSSLSDKYQVVETIVFGDHGMVEVQKTLDIQRLLKNMNLRLGKDFLYFLDSTLARFWFFNERAERIVIDLVGPVGNGSFITKKEREQYRISYKSRKFGDAIFWVEGGSMIFPNFWHRRQPKIGMHGYRWEVTDNHAAFLYHSTDKRYGSRLSRPSAMQDVFATTVRALGLEIPAGARRKAIQSMVPKDGLPEAA